MDKMAAAAQKEQDEESKKRSARDICVILLIVAVAIGIAVGMIVYLAGVPHTTTTILNLTPKLEKAIKESAQVSLSSTPEWSPYRLDTAETIIGVTLGYPEAYELHQPAYLAKLANMNIDLQAALIKDSELSSNVWSRGKLAQYISGIVVSCQHENATAYYGSTNLLDILETHLVRSLDYFRINRFALSWMALAMCQHQRTFDQQYEDILTAHPGTYTFGTDEASMVAMACLCLNTSTSIPAANAAVNSIVTKITEVNNGGLNVYSLGLAAQALIATKNESYADHIARTRMAILSKMNVTDIMRSGLAVSHILPVLAGRSYLDIEIHPSLPALPGGPSNTVNLQITITMQDSIMTNTEKNWNAIVIVPSNPTLLQAMDALEESTNFSFETTPTSFGPMVTTIDGITRNETNQYWQVLMAPDTPLSKGVSSTYPQDGDHYIFRLTYFGPH